MQHAAGSQVVVDKAEHRQGILRRSVHTRFPLVLSFLECAASLQSMGMGADQAKEEAFAKIGDDKKCEETRRQMRSYLAFIDHIFSITCIRLRPC